MNNSQEDSQKFLKVTNQLTDFAFILIFMIALPGIIGVIAGGIAMLFVEEAFLMGEFSLGTFLAGITFSLPIFYLLFLKTRKKKIWYEIIPISYNKELTIGILIIYVPTILTSLIFYLFSLMMNYSSFAFEFQFFILAIQPLESLFFCRFFKILFPISESVKKTGNIPEISAKLNKESLQKVIFKEFVIKIIFDIICLVLSNSILIIILTNVIGIILYFTTKDLIFKVGKLKTRLSEFKLILNLKFIGFLLIIQSLIQFWICIFEPNLNLGLYIIITALLTIKISFILLYQYSKHLFINFQIRVKWFIGFMINDIITIAINILGVIYIVVEGFNVEPFWVFSEWYLLGIFIVFLIENIIERHFHLSYKLLSTLFNMIQLIAIYAIIAFLLIDVELYLQILIFSVLSISIPIILHEIKAISKKTQIIIQNILYILIFYEIGIYFAVFTTENNLFITDSQIFNYLFFLSLSSLSSLYRLYFIKIRGFQTKFFSQLILIFLFISFFGIFQLIGGGLIGISVFLVEFFGDINSTFPIFFPTGLLSNSLENISSIYNQIGEIALDSTFIIKSTNGIASVLNIAVSGLLSLVGYNIIIHLHENFKVLSPYVLKFNQIFNRSLIGLLACIGILVMFQSISGIILCLMFITYFSVYIYDSIYEFREEIQKPLRKSKLQVKSILFIINAIVSLALFLFIGLEFLGLDFTLSFTIALIALYLYINLLPSINSILNRTYNEKKLLNLLNACILFLIGIFLNPSINFLLSSYISPDLELGILNWILISGLFISLFSFLSLKQLKSGNYVLGKIYEISNMLLQFFFWFMASGFIIFNTYKVLNYLLLIISINLLLLSVIFKINSILTFNNIYREVYLTWIYMMSITWELGFVTLISSFIIAFNYINLAFLIFLGLLILGILTYRNIKQYISIYPAKKEQIIKLLDFIHLFNLIVTIGIFQTFFSFFSSYPVFLPLSFMLTSILTSIVFHISKIVKKYLPDKIAIIIDVILLLTLSTSSIISVHSIFENYLNIQLIFDYSIIFSLGVVIIGLATLLLIAYYLEKRKIINTLTWNYINFVIIQLEILISFSFIMYSEFEWVINNLNSEWDQLSTPITYLILGGMILGLYLIYKSFLKLKYLNEHAKLTLLLLIQKNFTRIIGTIVISIFPIIFFNYELIGFSIAFFLITFVLVYSFKEFQNTFPANQKLNVYSDIILISNLLSILLLIYSISSHFIGLIITESLILSFITFWIFLYFLPILIKYIPARIKHVINAIFMPVFAVLVNISVYLEILKFEIDLLQDHTLISILIGLIPLFASILFALNQLQKGKYLKDKLHKKIHFLFNMGIYYDLYAIIVSVMLIYVIGSSNLNVYRILFHTSWPLLGLFFILKRIEMKNFYSEISHLKLILKTQILMFWGISTLGLLIIINYIFVFNPLVIAITIFIETFVLFYSILLFDEILPKLHKFLLIMKEILIYINLISISSVIYFTSNELLGLIPTFSFFIVLIIVSGLLFSIPVYKTGTIQKSLYEIISFLIFSSSILLAISINQMNFLPGTSPTYAYFGLLLIPILASFFSIFLFSKNTISKRIARKLYQKNEILLLINVAILIALLSNENGLNNFSLLISSLIVTALLVVDYYTIFLLTDKKTIILSFFSALLYNLVGITLAISLPLFETFDNPIFIFILVQLPFLFGIFYFVDWANRRIQSATNLKDLNKRPFSKLSNTKKNHINQSDEPLLIDNNEEPSNNPSKFAPTTIMNRFAQFISDKWIILEVCFIFITLGLNLYLGINILLISEEIFTPLQILLICSLIVSVITIYQPHSHKFLIYYIQTLVTLGLNYIIYDSTLFISEFQILFGIIAAILINRLATRHFPINNLIKYIQNFLLLGIYYFIIHIYGFTLSWELLISCILFSIFTSRSYKNLTFNSFKVWAFSYFTYDILINYLSQTEYPLIPIFAACAIGLTWQWIVFLKDSKWSNSIIKSLLGYIVTISWIFNYAYLFIIKNEIMGLISPPIMAFVVLLLLFLKKKIIIFQKEKFLDILILGGTFFFIYTLGRYYLFENYYFSVALALTLAGAICGFLFIFILEFLNAKIRKELSLAFFTCASLLAGVFTFLILMEPVIFTETAWEVALPIGFDIALLLFYIGIGIYKRSFTKIWSVGVYAWILAPIINFIMISRLIRGIDSVSSALEVFNVSIDGSIILSIIICTLMYLPIIITRLLENLNKIIYIFWLELLVFTTWGAVNLFPQSILLQIPFIFLIGLILFVPIFYYYKHWASLSLIWPLIAATNIAFVLNFVAFQPEWEIPIGILIGGFYILTLGYFPNIKKSKLASSLIIIFGYFTILTSIFWLLYTFVIIIFDDIIISVNITLIVISFVLLTGKYFKLRDYLIKIGHSLIVIINLAILLARTFYIIGNHEYKTFGIFLGIAFAFGTTLSFQARKYLPKILFELIWFGMAIFFGLSLFELGLTIFDIGGWASTGILVIVATLIYFPIIRSYLGSVFVLLVSGISMVIMELLILASPFVSMNQPLLFLDVLFTLELTYIYFSSKSKIGLLKDKTTNFEIASIIWVILSTLFSITFIFMINIYFPEEIFSKILIFLNTFALQNLLTTYSIRRNELFTRYRIIQKIIPIFHFLLIFTIYLSTSIFCAIKIPVNSIIEISEQNFAIETLYRFAILFLILFIEFYGIDRKIVKLVSNKIRYQLDWISFFAFSACLTFGLFLNIHIWEVSLLIWCILFFITIFLNQKAGNKIFPEILKIVNVLLINTAIFSYIWKINNITDSISNFEFDLLLLNIAFNIALIYLFMRLKIINRKAIKVIFSILSITIALFCEEISRIYLMKHLILNIAVFFFVFAILNTFNIKRAILIYFYWILLAFSISTFLMEFIPFLYHMTTINYIITLSFIFGLQLSLLFYLLANSSPNSNLENNDKKIGISIVHPILDSSEIAHKIFVTWMIIEAFIVSISIAQFWNYLFIDLMFSHKDFTGVEKFFLWISIIPIIFAFMFYHLNKYMQKNEVWKDKNYVFIGNSELGIVFKALSVIFLNLSLFYHLWYVFDIYSSLIIAEFGPILLNLTLNLFILYSFIRKNQFSRKWQFLTSIALSVAVSGVIEEYLRVFSNISPLMSVAIILSIICILNTNKINITSLVYSYWTTISFCLAIFLYSLTDWMWGGFGLSFSSVLWFSFLFGLFNTLIYYLLAHRTLIKLEFFQKYSPYLRIIEGFDYEIKSIDNDVDKKDSLISKDKPRTKSKSAFLLLFGHEDQIQAKQIFSIWLFIELIILSFSLAQGWAFVYNNNILYNVISDDNFIQYLIQATLVILLLSIGLAIIFQYIRSNNLWVENKEFNKNLIFASNFNGICLYFSLPLASTFYIHYTLMNLFGNTLVIALIDIFAFTILAFICIYLIDIKKTKIIKEKLANSLTIGIIILLSADISFIWSYFTELIPIGIIIFVCIPYVFKFLNLVKEDILGKLLFISNLLISIAIMVQIDIFLFGVFDWMIALGLLFLVLQIFIELEIRLKFLSPIEKLIKFLRKISWFLLSICVSSLTIFYNIEDFTIIRLIIGILILTLMMFYENYLLFSEEKMQLKYSKIKDILGMFCYIEIFSLLSTIIIPLNLAVEITETKPILFMRLLLVTELFVIIFILCLIDKIKLHFIPDKVIKPLDLTLFLTTIILGAVDLTYFAVLNIDLSPSTTPGPGIPIEQKMIPLIFVSIIIGIVLIIKFKNRKINQIIYFVLLIEIFIYILGLNQPLILIPTTIIALLLYPFIFFLEQMVILLKLIGKWILNLMIKIKNFFSFLWNKIVSFYYKHKRLVFSVLGLILAAVSFIVILNLAIEQISFAINGFISGLIFLIVYYPVSPEREEDTKPRNFALKILYRTLIMICLVGSSSALIPSEAWIYTLFLLAFFGYVIWVVRRSEELYNLPIYWRFMSSLGAIIDFIVTAILLILYLDII
ncbi:hypothetical protein DSAG12_00898 [Promethearchaeum syntrophicum]|uniref:Uncharacterized protein n=1 Tax=Promethearchaeum syntrophicum TaxID=2594042 RepID=A0A5B9D7T7_9ARCH|nr:hypothetical protein [Candidatus Prometheoarchaeum syntrophicum]QEE15075.1 hypothetical protein DSAG12_00898 [Candidatus Prometheoarchaeum syntrophicum]